MKKRFFKPAVLWIFFLSTVVLWAPAAYCATPGQILGASKIDKAQGGPAEPDPVELPEGMDVEAVDALLAKLSDEQVRRLLIQELKESLEAKDREVREPLRGFPGLVQIVQESAAQLRKKLETLRQGVVAAPSYLPETLAQLTPERKGLHGIMLTLGAALLFLASGAAAEWVLKRLTASMRGRIQAGPAASHWSVKMKRLALLFCFNLMGLGVFVVANLILFFALFEAHEFQRLIFFTYLLIVVAARIIILLSGFILAPSLPALRFIPVGDGTASYVHRWVVALAALFGVGLFLRASMEMGRQSEALLIVVRSLSGLVFLSMLLVLVFQNRRRIGDFIAGGSDVCVEGSVAFRSQFASVWHLLAIPYAIAVWVLWIVYLLLGRTDLVLPILATLMSLPIYMVLNLMGQKLLDMAFGLVEAPKMEAPLAREPEGPHDPPLADQNEEQSGESGNRCTLHGFVPYIRTALSASIAGTLFFWLLRLWGFEVHVGERVMEAVFQILVAAVLTYLLWKFLKNLIDRKLEEVEESGAADDDEKEMGGAGGSRVGTLLRILRKFVLVLLVAMVAMIILSSLGVNIGPLLAGAGVVGLAIGFGSQTLVKDIVSGVFFLVDDAFRLGDYIESGSAKGTVEHISIRSVRLRHHRGPIYTVPFGDMGAVTNYSRDFIVMKLEFRVPYGTDVDKVRKIVKKINKKVEKDEELGPKLLAPIKSQGVKQFDDDSAMVMRIKFKTIPGEQFIIRKEVWLRLQEAFRESGIDFAPRQVIVRMPSEGSTEKGGDGGQTAQEALLPPGAAAALSDVLDQEVRQKRNESQG